ncbi:MAG: hypothetical protein QXQ53_06865 [Candidatus Methanosuratincola sp.]
MGGHKVSPSRWSPGFGTLKPAALMSVWTEGGQFLQPERAERAVSGWKGARPVSPNCSGRERREHLARGGPKGAVSGRRMWAERAAWAGTGGGRSFRRPRR